MKLKMFVVSAIVASFGLSGLVFAAPSNYNPPERLSCSVDNVGKLSCDGFDRNYLVEDTYTADFPADKEVVFVFSTGVAYFAQDDWQVFYTYKDTNGKNVKLKSTAYSIKPDLQGSQWKKGPGDFYNCNAGYMNCAITNLPSLKM